MVRLKLQRFDLKENERGFTQESNAVDALEFVVDPASDETYKTRLIEVLKTFLD